MPKRISKDAHPKDINQAAFQMVRLSTAEPEAESALVEPAKATRSEISRVMAEMGRKGGQVGGKRRLETMTKAERTKVAKRAAKARWSRKKQT